jgi:hypothetical protein
MITQSEDAPKLFLAPVDFEKRRKELVRTFEKTVLRFLQSPEFSGIDFRPPGVGAGGRACL